jgi:hypothetical protein
MCPEAAVRVNQPLTAGGRGVQPLAFKTWMGLWDPKMFGACTCQTFDLRRAGATPGCPPTSSRLASGMGTMTAVQPVASTCLAHAGNTRSARKHHAGVNPSSHP